MKRVLKVIIALVILVLVIASLPKFYFGVTGLILQKSQEKLWKNEIVVEVEPQEKFLTQTIFFTKYHPQRCEDGILILDLDGNKVNFQVINSTYENGRCVEAVIKFKNVKYTPTTTILQNITTSSTTTSVSFNITNKTSMNISSNLTTTILLNVTNETTTSILSNFTQNQTTTSTIPNQSTTSITTFSTTTILQNVTNESTTTIENTTVPMSLNETTTTVQEKKNESSTTSTAQTTTLSTVEENTTALDKITGAITAVLGYILKTEKPSKYYIYYGKIVSDTFLVDYSELEQGNITINQPVDWKQDVVIFNPFPTVKKENISLDIPKDAFNVEIYRGLISNSSSIFLTLQPQEKTALEIRFQTAPVEMKISKVNVDLSELLPKEAFNITVKKGEKLVKKAKSANEIKIQVPDMGERITIYHNSSLHYKNIKILLPKNITSIKVNERNISSEIFLSKNKTILEISHLSTVIGTAVNNVIKIQHKAVVGKSVKWTLVAGNYTVEYETPAPLDVEKILNGRKRIIVFSNFSEHYHNITVFTSLPELPYKPKLYRIVDGSRINVTDNPLYNVTYFDENNNSKYDKIQWNVPQLSNDTYEVDITILNPYTYLRNGDTWTVAFNTTGVADLEISSPNANWTEMLRDLNFTKDEMKFLNLTCGNISLKNRLKIQDSFGLIYNYRDLTQFNSIKPKKFIVENYSCPTTGYFSNYMYIAGYAHLKFQFGDKVAYAYDPTMCYNCTTYKINITLYNPSGQYVAYHLNTTPQQEGGTCGFTPEVNYSALWDVGYTYCSEEGTYNVTIDAYVGNSTLSVDKSSCDPAGAYWETSSSMNAYTVNWDNDQNWCECHGDYWNSTSIDYDAGNPSCCGDDANEYRVNRTCAPGVCTSDSSDWGCCDVTTDCAYSSTCYSDGQTLSGPNGEMICDVGTWKDHDAPNWSQNKTNPSSPTLYEPGKSYQFNITWVDDMSSVDEVIFEFDGTNYSYKGGEVSNSGDEYYITLTDLAANPSGYSYKWYANDTENNWNSTDTWSYVINKGPVEIDMWLNGTLNSDKTITYPSQANATCKINITQQNSFNLYRNGTSVGTQSGQTIEYVERLPSEVFNFTCYYPETQNYSSYTKTHYLTVYKGTPDVKTFIDGLPQNKTVTYPTSVTAKGNSSTTITPPIFNLYLNSLSNTGNPATITTEQGAGTYNVVYNTSGNANWTSAENNTLYLIVNKGTLSLSISGGGAWAYPHETTVHGVESNQGDSDVTYQLWRNTTKVDDVSPYWDNITLGAGYYLYRFNATGGANWTANTTGVTTTVTINQNQTNPVDIYLNNGTVYKNQNITITYGTQTTANVTPVYQNSGTVHLYRDSSSVSNPETITLGGGYYEYKGNITGNENYSSNSTGATYYITVNKAQASCSLTSSNGWEYTYDAATTLVCTCTGDGTTHLYFDNIQHDDYNDSSVVFAASESGHQVVCNKTTGTNYTSASNSFTLIIHKKDPSSYLHLALNDSENNLQVTYGQVSNATGWSALTNDQDLTFRLYRNTSTSYVSGDPASEIIVLGGGTHEYVYNTTGGQNYTSGSTPTRTVQVNPASCGIDMWLNDLKNSDNTITYGTQANATAVINVTQSPDWYLYRNESQVDSGPTTSSLQELIDLSAGYYNYTGYWQGNENYTECNRTQFLTVGKASSDISLTAQPSWTVTYPNETTIWCNITTGDPTANITIWRNNTQVAHGEGNQSYIETLGGGVWNITCAYEESQNYTGTDVTGYLTVNKGPTETKLWLNGTQGDFTYNYSQTANFTVVLNISGKTVYLDTNITGWSLQSGVTPLYNYTVLNDLGVFNITGYFPGDQNYSSSLETHYATVQDLVKPLWRNQGQNASTIGVGWPILLYAQGKDKALDFAWLETNETGAWQNKTTYSSPMDMNDASEVWTWSNFTWQNSSITESKVVGWRIYYNDTSGNENVTDTMAFKVDATPPTITIDSPQNIIYGSSSIWFNVTLDESGSWCGYSLNGAANKTMSNDSSTHFYDLNSSMPDGSYHVVFYCNDSYGNMGSNETWFTVSTMNMDITKDMNPNFIVARENETINVTTDVKINQTSSNITGINITDEVPYDFSPPDSSHVKVYNIEYEPYSVTDITNDVIIDVVNPGGGQNKRIYVNITNISQTAAGSYLELNDIIEINYLMNSSQMEPEETRNMWTNATAVDVNDNKKSVGENFTIKASQVVLRGWKDSYTPDLSNPQNIILKLVLEAVGGPVSEIHLADYIPQGATIQDLNVSYYNYTTGTVNYLVNGTDYLVTFSESVILPDGTPADIYKYNFTYASTPKWDGNLYDKDNITITYNLTVLGGGQWRLPTIISGYDPTYKKYIKTETYATTRVPLFDAVLKVITDTILPGDKAKAILRLTNVGGPRARVDVFNSYSVKTMKGEVVSEKSETFAVTSEKTRELELATPKSLEPGMYTFESLITYTGREAMATDTFEVEGGFNLGDYLIPILLVVVILVLFIVFMVLRMRK